MNKFKKISLSTISTILIFLIAFLLPVQVMAEALPTAVDNPTIESALEENNAMGNIIGEDVSLRDEYTKYFVTDTGCTIVAKYEMPVHYKDDKGEFVEYDNSLESSQVTTEVSTSDESSVDEASTYGLRNDSQLESVFVNKKSKSKVSHFKKSGKVKLTEITSDGYTISWSYSGSNVVVAVEKSKDSEELTGNDKYLTLDNLSSQVNYENIYNNIDLEVINSTIGVKENLILKTTNAKNVFKIDYNIGELVAECVDENTIELKDSEGQVVYTISAPYMVDANGETSEALELKILSNNKGKLSVKLTADKTWLKDKSREYPVTIDPSIVFGDSAQEVTSAYVNSGDPDKVMGQQTNCAVSKTDTYECYGLFKINELPGLKVGDYIVNSELNVYPMSTPASDMQLRAYKVTSAWTNNTVTYNNTTFDSTIIDYANVTAGSQDVITFDITKLAKEWYNGAANNGVLLRTEDIAGISLGGYCCYYSDCKPMFTVTYKNYVGTEPQLTYRTHSTNIHGTGYVSDALGTMVLRQTLVEETGSRMPVTITMTYNSLLSDTYLNNGSVMGNGWHISFNRYIDIPSDELQALGYEYVYTDEDGTEHYFTKYEATEEEMSSEDYIESWIDEDDLGYVITQSGNYILLDTGNGVIAKFDNPLYGGKILSETDDYGNTISYMYTYGNLTRITDGAGRIYSIGYYTSSSLGIFRVNRIDMPDGSQILFTYGSSTDDRDYIYKVAYSDRETVTYTYDEEAYRISSVQSTCGANTTYSYNENGTVSKITDEVSGNYLNFTYNSDNTTQIEDKQGRSETYTFDNTGNTVSILNADGHLENTDESSGNFYLSTSSDSYTKNHIINSSIETTGNYYVTYGDTSNKGSCIYTVDTTEVNDEAVQYLGNQSLRIRNSATTQETWGYQTISTTELAGRDVTFSSYVKTSNIVLEEGATGAAGVFLKMRFYNSAGSMISEETSYAISGTNKWQRMSVTGFAHEDTAKVRVYFGVKNASGTAWFDCLQCEEASCMNDINLLSNSDFTLNTSWNGGDCLTGDTTLAKSVQQTVNVNKANVSFNMTGTAQADSVPLKDNRSFGIKLKMNYADGTSEEHIRNFNAATSAMQSVNMFVTPEKSNVVISTVVFSFIYDYNIGTMNISDAMLNFEYNMYDVSASEDTGETTEESVSTEPYDGYAYTYDSYGNILTSSQGTVIPSEDGEDTLDSTKLHITTSTTYDATGNYAISETDSRGNTVSYSVDANNGRVNSVTDAKGNVTSYTYDAYGNVLSETSGDVTNTYTYAATGNLTNINHNGFNYRFGYDSYGNNTATYVENIMLIKNLYADDHYSLTKSTFGNGDAIFYAYDNMGRVIEISNAEDTLVKYVYNKKGAVAKIIDVASGNTTDYWYNVSGVALSTTSYNSDGTVTSYSTDTTDGDGNQITISAIGDVTRVVTLGVDANDNSYVNNDGWTNTVTLDSFGRVTNKSTAPGSDNAFTSDYTYLVGATDNTTTELIDDVVIKHGDTDVITYSYVYDSSGNITKEYQNGEISYTYIYDGLNQLKATKNCINNTFTNYTYDSGGNIVRELIREWDSENGYPTTTISDISYDYGISAWKDLLTSYNGDAITYDKVGNPLTYRDGMTMTWQNGRELATLTKDGKTISYSYNADGIRTEKNNNGVITKYFYDSNNNLTSLICGDTQLVFYYAADGQADSFTVYSGDTDTRYYYVKNHQGDVTKIMSADGAVVANYYYDAYGEILSITGADGAAITDTSSVAFINPLRYRGYVYDDDAGFYYLQSRYYDPTTKRFVNADSTTILMFSLVDDENIGLSITNLFAYCYNNPIMNTDKIGLIAGVDDATVVALILLFAYCVSMVLVYMSTPQFKRSWTAFCDMIGNGLASIGSIICNGATAVWKWSSSKIKKAYAAVSLYITVFKADVKIKSKVKRSSNTRYWSVTVYDDYVAIGAALSFEQAKSYVRRGKSVFAVTNSEACNVARQASGGKKPVGPENHGVGVIGYYYHYHVYGRKNKSHVYFLF